MDEPKFTFLRIEWDECPSVEMLSDGRILIDGSPGGRSDFIHALRKIAQRWHVAEEKRRAKSREEWGDSYGILVRGPFRQAECDAPADSEASPPASTGTKAPAP